MSESTHTQTTTTTSGGKSGAQTTTLLDISPPAEPELYFLSHRLTQLALNMYAELDGKDPKAADRFFETFGPGNILLYSDRPYERLSDYEELLKLLHKDDPEKYGEVHKGTPFYLMSWLAFDLRNFEKALFYMDAAISEDIRREQDGWLDRPAGSFLTLSSPEVQPAQRTIEMIRRRLNEQIKRFNSVSNLEAITVEQFINDFVRKLVQDVAQRTIVSALYVYLLEFDDRRKELRLRSKRGGSIAPFIIHLFKGALICESLLKHRYPRVERGKDRDQETENLGEIFQKTSFCKDFVNLRNTSISAKSLQEIIDGIADDSQRTAFIAMAKIRNTTGHKLVWDDAFKNPVQYERLFQQEINALLYIVSIKFCH